MAITPERFAQGLTYEAFKAQMEKNREKINANEEGLRLTAEDLTPFQRLPRTLHVLATAEDWCPDVIDNLPILSRIARESGTLDVRVFLRDQNLDIADQFLYQGKFRSVPTFVFFDDDFQEIGRFIERSQNATNRRLQFRQEFFGSHPHFGTPDTPIDQLSEEARAAYLQAIAIEREKWTPLDAQDTVRELQAIVKTVKA